MNTFSPRMPIAPNLSGGAGFSRRSLPGDVGDSLFRNFLRQVNDQDQGGGGAWLPLASVLNNPGAGSSGTSFGGTGPKGKGLDVSGLGAERMMLLSNDFKKLAQFLEQHGFSSQEIDRLFHSLADKNGDIRMDRLFAKLHALFRDKAASAPSPMVDRSDVPRIQEALFKLGLGAEQVSSVVKAAANADGHLSVRRLASAVGKVFHNLDPDMEKRLEKVLQQVAGIRFRPGDLQQTVREAGLESEINRLTQGTSMAGRDAAKIQIAGLLQEKGIPVEEVKRFLESLRVQHSSDRTSGDTQVQQREGFENRGPVFLREHPSVRVYIHDKGAQWEKGGWKGRILDILNRQEPVRSNMLGPEAGKTASLQDPANRLEQALFGRSNPAQAGEKNLHTPLPRGKAPATNPEARLFQSTETLEKGASKVATAHSRSATESQPFRSQTGTEFSVPQTEKAAPPQPAASIRGPSAAGTLPEPLPKIIDRMVWMVRAGEQTSRIHISPPDLGRIDLDIVIRNGHLQANVSAENPMAKELIEANLQQLKQQLNNLGFVVERFEVASGLNHRRFSENQDQFLGRKGRNGQRRSQGSGTDNAGVEPVRSVSREDGSLYQIDVHV